MIRNTALLLVAALAGVTVIAAIVAVETTVSYDIETPQINPNFTNEELREIASDEYIETPEEIIARYESYIVEEDDNASIIGYWERARLQQIINP